MTRWRVRQAGILRCYKYAVPAIVLCGVLYLLWSHSASSVPPRDLREQVFARLEGIRNAKMQKVRTHLEAINRLAAKISTDETMLRFFDAVCRDDYHADDRLELEIDKHYVTYYGPFYDIIFVGRDGFVHHSCRKESDYHTSLFVGPLAKTSLARTLQKGKKRLFVDYEYYLPSDEPAAFFVEPVHNHGDHVGWIVLQYSINDINTILNDRQELGRTGEVYLVNGKSLMLTESRFLEDSSILKLRIDTQAVAELIKQESGQELIDDYRGVSVFSSFERFDFLGVSWIIIAEIDEDEVITEHYREYRQYYQDKIVDYLARTLPQRGNGDYSWDGARRVDMNEFARAEPGTTLHTVGVALCTCITVACPSGPGYLAHISPTDRVYAPQQSVESDFLRSMLQRVTHYSVRPCEIRLLRFTVVAPHHRSFARIVDRLLAIGAELSNITFVHDPTADSANVLFDPATNQVEVQWLAGSRSYVVHASEVEDLGVIVKKLLQQDV